MYIRVVRTRTPPNGFSARTSLVQPVRTYRHLTYEKPDLPDQFEDDPRTPPTFVETFIRKFTEPGDTVLDPFAGFGTTLRVATALDREAVGVEYDQERAAFTDKHAPDATVHCGDALSIPIEVLPAVDCVFTSPPYMVAQDHRNPFENYNGESTYGTYLGDLKNGFARLRPTLESGASLLVDVSNMKYDDHVTTLAWDVARELAERFHFAGEIIVTWEGDREGKSGSYGYGYDHNYLLTFEYQE